ncbi:hypothetical protein [Kribbella catacumbae]|uniref:hypothetical protein n=1 Tax=Kribbella catacumbae TaxID=460086 RepID=UPI00037D6628|nr:hypothetical protein [Kribbella catacumbae]
MDEPAEACRRIRDEVADLFDHLDAGHHLRVGVAELHDDAQREPGDDARGRRR